MPDQEVESTRVDWNEGMRSQVRAKKIGPFPEPTGAIHTPGDRALRDKAWAENPERFNRLWNDYNMELRYGWMVEARTCGMVDEGATKKFYDRFCALDYVIEMLRSYGVVDILIRSGKKRWSEGDRYRQGGLRQPRSRP